MKRILLASVTVLAALAFLVPVVHATTMYTSRSAWETAVGGVFADVNISPNPGDTLSAGSPLALPSGGTVSFSSDLLALQVPSGWATWSGGNLPKVFIGPGYTLQSVTGTFSSSVAAFGLEMEPDAFDVFPMTLRLSDGSILTQDVEGEAGALFFGWADGSISFMDLFISPNQAGGSTDFAFGRMVGLQASAVPEPATMLLLGSGLLGIGIFARRRFRK